MVQIHTLAPHDNLGNLQSSKATSDNDVLVPYSPGAEEENERRSASCDGITN